MRLKILTVACGVILASCQLEPKDIQRSNGGSRSAHDVAGKTKSGDQSGQKTNPGDDEEEQKQLGLSEHPRLRFKKQKLFSSDLQQALELSAEEVCKELGALDCINEVHHIELGGVDAYEKTIYTPQEATSATTPIIIERVILSACTQRQQIDLGGGADAILTSNPIKTGTELVQRAFLREPSKSELEGFEELYKQLGPAEGALAACYAVFTSTEFLFY